MRSAQRYCAQLPGDAEAVLGCFLCSVSPKTSLKQTNHRRCIENSALACPSASAEGLGNTRYVIEHLWTENHGQLLIRESCGEGELRGGESGQTQIRP